jgi:hypothetical protein
MGSPTIFNPSFRFMMCCNNTTNTTTFSLGTGWTNLMSNGGTNTFNAGHAYNFIVILTSSTTASIYGGFN